MGLIHNPKLSLGRGLSEQWEQPPTNPFDLRGPGLPQTQDYKSGMIARGIAGDIRKVEIERDETPAFSATHPSDFEINGASHALVKDGTRVMSSVAEQLDEVR